jgi:hypothetical protein
LLDRIELIFYATIFVSSCLSLVWSIKQLNGTYNTTSTQIAYHKNSVTQC